MSNILPNPLTHVDSQLPKVRVELAREAQAGGDTRHDDGHVVVKIAICWCGELERPEADVVKRLVIDTEGLIRVLNELINGKGGVVGLDDGIGNLRRGNDRESGHHTVGVFFPDLRDEEGTHACTGTTAQRVGNLEACASWIRGCDDGVTVTVTEDAP